MSSEFLPKVIGHEKAKGLLSSSLNSNKLAHAYILSGPRGMGKFLLAYEFAKSLGGNSLGPDTTIIYADKIGIEAKKQLVIGVDEIRELENFLRLTAANYSYRVGIIDGVEYMTHNAANALLKILEEPGDNTVIFLITHSIGKIVATIRSRCLHLACNSLSEKQLISILRNKLKKDDVFFDYASLLRAANNDISLAIKIHQEELLNLIQKIENSFLTKEKKYISEISQFASENKDNWEVVKTTLIRCAYSIAKSNRMQYLGFQETLDRTMKIINMIINCEKDNLDKTKVIAFCLS